MFNLNNTVENSWYLEKSINVFKRNFGLPVNKLICEWERFVFDNLFLVTKRSFWFEADLKAVMLFYNYSSNPIKILPDNLK